jgi:maltose alpha-D-glucosyltransferase/alpha-amylase
LIGEIYLEMIRLLGRRTAEMHRALAGARDDPAFAPEPLRQLDLRSLSQTILSQIKRVRESLASNHLQVSNPARRRAARVLSDQAGIGRRLRRISRMPVSGMKIRTHGDFHLGQVLYTGKDFTIIDFEGEPSRSLSERRLKRSPLRDVAGMLRSFHYAAYGAIFLRSSTRPQDIPRLRKWADLWYRHVSRAFVDSYLENLEEEPFLLPRRRAELRTLLDSFILEKAIYELEYELNHRPGWLIIPLRGIQSLLSAKV